MLLEVSNLTAAYGSIEVLFGVSFEIAPGEVVTLLGRNGMGKTTTVRALSGLLSKPAGRIMFDGRPIIGLASYRIARLGLGLVPEGRHIFPNLTVKENLLMAASNLAGASDPGRWTRSLPSSRGLAIGCRTVGRSSPAANSKCWRSGAR